MTEPKILLVEDNFVEAQIYTDMLRELFQVEHVDRIETALDRLAGGGIDLILLDLVLPDSDPADTFLRIQSLVPQIPVIALTSLETEGMAEKTVRAGAQDYLLKDGLSSKHLVRSIRHALERKHVEVALLMMAKAVETMQIGVTITDLDGSILYANPAECRIHGYEPGELVGKDVRILSPPDYWKPMNSEVLKTITSWQRESINVRCNGGSFPVRLLSDVVVDASRRPIGIITTCEDITERRQVEEAMRHGEEKYRTIIETIEDGYYEIDLSGNLTFFNDSLCRILGFSRAELRGMNNRMFMDEVNAEKVYQIVKLVYQTGRPAKTLECQIVRKDGVRREVEISVSPITYSNQGVVGFRGIVRDITERKAAERFLLERTKIQERARALERSNQELEQFASVASHDLQEPLRKIQAFGQRLKEKCSEGLSEEGLDYLERMTNASKRMQTMIQDLLTFARVTTHSRPFVPVPLARIVRDVVNDLELQIESTGGRVEYERLPVIEADLSQMRQLFLNLIGNGLKFHREGDSPMIRIYSELNVDSESSSGGSCRITIEDNGIGFDERHIERIFLPFSRLHGRSDYEGTGIGLAICRRIVERHRGNITARSVPGKGSKFILTFPLRQHGHEKTFEEGVRSPEKDLQIDPST